MEEEKRYCRKTETHFHSVRKNGATSFESNIPVVEKNLQVSPD